ncbi:hypothetical protein CsatA_004681 [Cannabis sativa]
MKPHQKVCDYLLQMGSYFEEAENHGAIIDQETQTFENLIGGPQKRRNKAPSSSNATASTTKPEANIASTSKPGKKKKLRNNKKSLKAVNTANKNKKGANPKSKDKEKYFYCNEKSTGTPVS